MDKKKYLITETYHKFRIDIALAQISGISRSQIKNMMKEKLITCNKIIINNTNHKVQQNDVIEFESKKNIPSEFVHSNIPLNIVFEDEHILVINKPAGMVVHPAAGNHENTVVNAVLSYCDISGVGDSARPGIVHRLDKDTSGLMIIAKTNQAHAALSAQFVPVFNETDKYSKKINRTYFGIVYGCPSNFFGTIKTKIARHHVYRQQMCNLDIESNAKRGKISITNYFVEKVWSFPKIRISLMRFQLLTGRTHQIRVHCQYLKIPLVGDQVYCGKISPIIKNSLPEGIVSFPRQALHAKSIDFYHPITKEFISLDSEFPEGMENLIKICNAENFENTR
ncbi:MAG: RluA family pseudouridine synthase [Holosporales bacterium]|jgi:23S rRNA pseudouridine1911/1915/1917 synthase|nr:RluA family pseudouridine synthase [Holosporales bacterium]